MFYLFMVCYATPLLLLYSCIGPIIIELVDTCEAGRVVLCFHISVRVSVSQLCFDKIKKCKNVYCHASLALHE